MKMTAVIIHLSDIHIGDQRQKILEQASNIACCAYKELPNASAAFIVVSGDIAQSGKAEEYLRAKEFLLAIKEAIETEKNIPVNFVLVPGNHDCDFELDTSVRQITVGAITTGSIKKIDAAIIDQCTAVQRPYLKFRDEVEAGAVAVDDLLWRTQVHVVEGKRIIFDALNISWVSQIEEEQGALCFPHERYLNKEEEGSDIRLVVMHHPLNWFSQHTYRSFRAFIRKLADIVITGHEHIGNIGENTDTESNTSVYIEGCVLQGKHDLGDSAFNVVVIDLAESKYCSTRYKWAGKNYEATEDGSWADYRSLAIKKNNDFEIRGEFRQVLDDAGADFQHPNCNGISLADVYIHPDLFSVSESTIHRKELVSSSILLDPEQISEGVLLEGEEKVGSTSLLYRLYDTYHARGLVPVLIKGEAIRRTKERDIVALIKGAVEQQYGKKAWARFEQLPSSSKVLLIDDFDSSPIQASNARAELLCYMRKVFKYIAITVSELFEAKETLQGADAGELKSFVHYRIQPFGYKLRGKLIQKWFQLGNDGTIDEGQMIARCDTAEKAMDTIMARNIIPSMPLYLLIFMQSIDAGRTGDFKDSALGHYYDFLLSQSFLGVGISPEKLPEYFEYCTQLSWYFHSLNDKNASEEGLRKFNAWFSGEFHTVDFKDCLERLLKAKLLILREGFYSFRYPYIYYFLKGRYLSLTIYDVGTREYVKHCCRHLYVRENANTVLFLAHHTGDDFVIRSIIESLDLLFDKKTAVKFQRDTEKLSALIEDASELTYSGVQPKEHRAQVQEMKDEMDGGHDGLLEREEDGDALSLVAELTTLFKTVEILGQALKNQYARLTRVRKIEILEKLFSGPLRALTGFYDHLQETPDYLVSEIDKFLEQRHKLEDKEERKHVAKRIAADLIQFVSFGFIYKASASVSSESLHEDIRSTVKKNNTPAFSLIELGVLLDSAEPVPKDLILRLKEDAKKEPMAMRLLQMLALHHVYMFKTTEMEKQWLADTLKLNLGTQHSVDFKTRNTKLIK